jgi:hypothetical protein
MTEVRKERTMKDNDPQGRLSSLSSGGSIFERIYAAP